jgi:hypothetical protein
MSDWIKVEKATLHKPEVLAVSEALGIHPVHAFGLCVKFWMWCDDQILDGNARGVTKVTLDFVIGHPGMTDALLNVGWLRDRSGSLEVPHFDRHLSEGSKTRALTKERVRKSKGKSNAPSVTEVTQEALLDKRREEKNILSLSRENKGAQAPELPECLRTQQFEQAWEGYIAYRRKSRYKTLQPDSIAAKWREMAEWGHDNALLAIAETISNGWQGIFEPKPKPNTTTNHANHRDAKRAREFDADIRPVVRDI